MQYLFLRGTQVYKMALRWLLHSACHLVGYPTKEEECKENEGYPNGERVKGLCPCSGFEMPLHYPRYTREEYESMEEWKVELLLKQYGLSLKGSVEEKRVFAMGAFLWP
ncbi:hypothetical protein LR48_Vigan09g199800 [Vigna angularis]|uniref:DUF7722 domain-containing protein n=3 Tax=Phaseolus angularis TaxID=3914 RepID=A0A0L9VF77_PHAAN|nr:uncharacterized protein LOC108342642 [Vigna angularis]KOM53339.1 hypothetical protein LR48_Vigan09g199800 [Vigna angularis]